MTERIVPQPDPQLAPDNNPSAALEASRVIKASPGVLYGLSGYNANAGTRYIQLFNSTTLPADTAVPVLTIPVATGASFNIDFGAYGMGFSVGIVVCNSSTGPTKTIGAADSWFTPRFK
jgi:hypothetical protein